MKAPLLIPLLATLLLTLPGAQGEEPVLAEDFESYTEGASVFDAGVPFPWQPSGHRSHLEAPGQAIVSRGENGNDTLVVSTTPVNAEGRPSGHTMNLSTSFGELQGVVRFSVDLYPQKGAAQILLRPPDAPSEAIALLQFRSSPQLSIVAFQRVDEEGRTPVPLAPFQYERWYRVIITARLEEQRYDVEIIERQSGTRIAKVEGLDQCDPATSAGNVLLGAIFHHEALCAWDNVRVEAGP